MADEKKVIKSRRIDTSLGEKLNLVWEHLELFDQVKHFLHIFPDRSKVQQENLQ
jgi:hypothetical protein